jgi:hypothetical protein
MATKGKKRTKPSKSTRALAQLPILQAPLAELPKGASARRVLGRSRTVMGLPYEYRSMARVRMSRREVAAINTDIALRSRRFLFSTQPKFAYIGTDGAVVEDLSHALHVTVESHRVTGRRKR